MFKKKNENVMTILKRSSGLKYKMIIHSFVVGLLAGGIIVGYRLLGEVLLKVLKSLYLCRKWAYIYSGDILASGYNGIFRCILCKTGA